MAAEEVKVPDVGDASGVEVVEVLVSAGDTVAVDDSLIVLESDKASMDVPSPKAGTVKEVKVSAGDSVSQGDVILTLEADGEGGGDEEGGEAEEKEEQEGEEKGELGKEEKEKKTDSDAGGEDGGEESEDEDSEGDEETEEGEDDADEEPKKAAKSEASKKPKESGKAEKKETSGSAKPKSRDGQYPHASPAVRRFARELGADLEQVEGSGRKGRITREDVQAWVKGALQGAGGKTAASSGGGGGFELPPMPEIDYSKFGDTETVELSRIRRRSAENLHRSWLHVPHVTQFDEADVTDLEAFRKGLKPEAEKKGVKLTFLPFLMKACVAALREYPEVNSSLAPGGESLVVKKYYHLGIAVDTDDGLIVPTVRDVDKKGLYELAEELADVAGRARDKKLKPDDLQGASFTISSLGGIGGTAFTPIVNAPQVAILGVSRMETKPVWTGDAFEPRKVLPLSFSYDHRVVDGALAARFTTYLAQVLSDLRRLLL